VTAVTGTFRRVPGPPGPPAEAVGAESWGEESVRSVAGRRSAAGHRARPPSPPPRPAPAGGSVRRPRLGVHDLAQIARLVQLTDRTWARRGWRNRRRRARRPRNSRARGEQHGQCPAGPRVPSLAWRPPVMQRPDSPSRRNHVARRLRCGNGPDSARAGGQLGGPVRHPPGLGTAPRAAVIGSGPTAPRRRRAGSRATNRVAPIPRARSTAAVEVRGRRCGLTEARGQDAEMALYGPAQRGADASTTKSSGVRQQLPVVPARRPGDHRPRRSAR